MAPADGGRRDGGVVPGTDDEHDGGAPPGNAGWTSDFVKGKGRSRRRVESFGFRPDDVVGRSNVTSRMDELGRAGRGWINLQPEVDEDDPPQRPSALGTLFGMALAPVAMCTWAPASSGRGHASLGVMHPGGRFVMTKLRGMGITAPAGAKVNQDHARRGLILHLPPDTDHAETLDFMVAAGTALSTAELTGAWRAQVHTFPSGGEA